MHAGKPGKWIAAGLIALAAGLVCISTYIACGGPNETASPPGPGGPIVATAAEVQAVESLVKQLADRCPANWDRPKLIETGTVQPFGYPKGQGWHIRTRRTSPKRSGALLDGQLDVWLMARDFAPNGPFELGKKKLTPENTADECTTWPFGRAFFRGHGGSDWPNWELDVAWALATSTPEGKLRRERVDKAMKALADLGLPAHLNLYSRSSGPYLEVVDRDAHYGLVVFPFPLDPAGNKKIVTSHAMGGGNEVLAAGAEYVLLGQVSQTRPGARQACGKIVEQLGLKPPGEKIAAAARAQAIRDRLDRAWLVLRTYDDAGKEQSSIVLSTVDLRAAASPVVVLSRQEALDIVDQMEKDGFFDKCVTGTYGISAPNVPQVTAVWFSRNENSTTQCDWQCKIGWNADTWSALKNIRGALQGPAGAQMDKFLAGFTDQPDKWRKERQAIEAVAADVRQAVNAVVEDASHQTTWVMRPEPSAELYRGVAADFQADPTLKDIFWKLCEPRPACLKAVSDLQAAKAAWCLTSALCSEDMEVARLAGLAMAELKDARPAGFVLKVARAYAAVPDFRTGKSRELNITPEAVQYALAAALDAMLGTNVKIKVMGTGDRKYVADHATFVKALAVWQKAIEGIGVSP